MVPLNNTDLALTSSMFAVIPVKPVATPASEIDDQSHLGNGVCFPLRLLFHCPVARERQNRCIGGQGDHCTGYKKHPSHDTHTHGADGFCLPKLMSSAIPDRQRPSD